MRCVRGVGARELATAWEAIAARRRCLLRRRSAARRRSKWRGVTAEPSLMSEESVGGREEMGLPLPRRRDMESGCEGGGEMECSRREPRGACLKLMSLWRYVSGGNWSESDGEKNRILKFI